MSDPGLEEVLDRYKAEWEAGQFDTLVRAYAFCALNNLRTPPWLFDAVWDDLKFAYEERRRGGRSARTGAVKDRSNRTHEIRHRMMQTALDQQAWAIRYGTRTQPPNKKEAAQEIERLLADNKSGARGSWPSILESYNSLETNED